MIKSADDEKAADGDVEYMRGPVKLMNRARSKAQNDYAKEPYPASACVIDFNRCALVFEDISSLLHGLQLFVNKVKYYQSGNIIAIARDKNGFIEYVKEAQYADIKLNVIIKGRHNSIIGEVQFLLRAMKEYKDKAHNLYAIQRKEDAIKTSVSATLPILLNQKKEILTVGCRGNVKQMCEIMVLQNQTIQDVLFVDEKSGNTVFHRVCSLGHLKLLSFLESMMDRNEFVDHIFFSNVQDMKPIEYAIRNSHALIVKRLFDMKEIQDRYTENDPLIFRLCCHLFQVDSKECIIEYVMSALQIKKEKVCQMLSYICPVQPGYREEAQGVPYHQFAIVYQTVALGHCDDVKRLAAVAGEQAFAEGFFKLTRNGYDAMRIALKKEKIATMEYMLSLKAIKNGYMSDNALLYRLVASMNKYIESASIIQCIVDKLVLTEAKLKEVKSFREIDIDKIIPFTKS